MSGWHPMIPWQFWRSEAAEDVIGAHQIPLPGYGYPAGYAGPDVLVDPDFGIVNPQVMREARGGDLPFNPRGGYQVQVEDLKALDVREEIFRGGDMDGYAIMGAERLGIDPGEFALSLASGLASGLAPRGKQVAQVSSAAESARLAEQARRDAKRRLVVYAGAGTALAAVVGLVLYLLLRRT